MDQEEQEKNKKRKKGKESGDDLEKEKARQRDTETKHMISLSRFCEIWLADEDRPYRRWLKEEIAKGAAGAVARIGRGRGAHQALHEEEVPVQVVFRLRARPARSSKT